MENALILKTKLDTKDFDREIAKLERDADDLRTILKDTEDMDPNQVKDFEAELEKTNNRLNDLYRKQNEINNQGFKKAKDTLDGVKDSTKDIGKSIMRWGLALIGVRSAMTLIRTSMSTLSQYDEQLSANIEYLRYALAVALKPVIEYIVDLIYKALQYLNMIVYAFTGYNLFANATADSMKRAEVSSGKMAKNIKEAKKDALGFDQFYKLTKDNTASGGGGTSGGGAILPNDLSNLTQMEIPEWMQWIIDNRETLLSVIGGVVGGLLAMKLHLGGIKALGIGLMITGIIELVKDLTKYMDKLDSSVEDNGTSWKELGKIFTDIGIVLIGLGLLIGSLPVALAGAIAIMIGLVMYFYEDITKDIDNIKGDIESGINEVEGEFGFFLNALTGIFGEIGHLIETCFTGTFKPIKQFVDGVLLLFKGDFKGGFENIFKAIVNIVIGALNKIIIALNIILVPLRALIQTIGSVASFFSGKAPPSMKDIRIPTLSYVRTGAIINFPSKGVPIGASAIGGESGAEGVIPLTDETAMERLGENIGRHCKINIDLTTEIEGRILARVLKQINNEDNFARNGG